MSVVVKGMDMPKNCWDCPLIYTSPCACKGYSTAIEHTRNRHPDCPLVPVPSQGRLGDLDELKERVTKRLYASNHGSMAEAYFMALIDLLDTALTIIPAEEEEE